tara:strand:- start:2814 stop:3470 length:657 start_codon:yes stop_codon:yes gene_type:complete
MKYIIRVGLIVSFALVTTGLVGCSARYTERYERPQTAVASTPYQAGGLPKFLGVGIVVNPFEHPFGYQEEKLGDASYKVTVETNTVTPPHQTFDFTLMRSAELGKIGGFDKFRVSYLAAAGVCRDNVGVQRNVAVMFVQYGRGDGPVGQDDEELRKAATRAMKQKSQITWRPVMTEYKVGDVMSRLEEKVKNPDAGPNSTQERITAGENFKTRCWGKP